MWTLTASGNAPTPAEEHDLYTRLAEALGSRAAGCHLALFCGSHVAGSPHVPGRKDGDGNAALAGLGR